MHWKWKCFSLERHKYFENCEYFACIGRICQWHPWGRPWESRAQGIVLRDAWECALRVIPNAYPILVRLEVCIPGGRLFISRPLEHLVVWRRAPHLLAWSCRGSYSQDIRSRMGYINIIWQCLLKNGVISDCLVRTRRTNIFLLACLILLVH